MLIVDFGFPSSEFLIPEIAVEIRTNNRARLILLL